MNDLVEVLRSKSAHDPALRALLKSIDSGKANFRDTAQYSIRYSHQLGNILSENVLDIPPDVRETAAEELLKYGYDDMNTILAEVQKSLDEQAGIHIRPQKSDFPSERVQQFAHSLIDPTVEDSVIKRRARSGSETITKSFHDSFIKKNAQFRNDAGLKCYITREGSNCCKWCSEVAGRYEFGSQPSDIFRRHDNCDCTIDYDGQKLRGKLNADGSRSKTWEEVPDADGSYEPKVLSVTDARAAEQRNLSQFRGIGSYHQIKSSAEIIFDRIDGSKPITSAFAEEYRKEYDSFTAIFGEMLSLRGVNIAPYQGYNVYGGYNPQSREITLIGVGGKQGKANMQAIASKNKKDGQWSTNSVYHTFRHELGHSLQKELELNDKDWALKRSKIEEIKSSLEKELTNLSESDKMIFKKSKLSKYGFESVDEFISESVAEYMNSPDKARKTAKSVVEILLGKE